VCSPITGTEVKVVRSKLACRLIGRASFSRAFRTAAPISYPRQSPSDIVECGRIGIDTHLHNLRHYSATELITAGVDIRTVAGRLGHSGGGTTTLRVYAPWVAEADQRAATKLASRLPNRAVTEPRG
jgi:integrase